MRHEHYRMSEAEAVRLLSEVPVVHVAAVSPEGHPVLRTVHGVVFDGALYFHGAPKGEKSEMAGWPAVLSAEEVVASVPSYYVDPERACPATTYYRSVMVHGRLEAVDAPAEKARALQALMEKLQPEGGHVPITAEHPLYRNAVNGILILKMPLREVSGKGKLGQNRRPDERREILARLWARGTPADVRAIDAVRAANGWVPEQDPAFLAAPPGLRLRCQLGLAPRELDEAVALVADEYWNVGVEPARITRAFEGSSAWVGAEDVATGRVVATARAVGDGAKTAWIYDVGVAPHLRRTGLGTRVVALLLAHPAVRDVRRVFLGTADAQGFYRRLGFVETAQVTRSPGSTVMVREVPLSTGTGADPTPQG